MKIKPIQENFGTEIICEAGESIADLQTEDVTDWFKSSGAILFRGFDLELDQYNKYTDIFSADYMTYKGGGYIRRKVNDGKDETLLSVNYDFGREKQDTFGLPLHGEMYYMDKRPVMLWFYCVVPAASDGETTICDGKRVYADLSPQAKELFETKHLKFIRHYQDGEWQKIYQTEDAEVAVSFARDNGITVDFDATTKIFHTEYLQPAVITSRWGNHRVFINNILPVLWQEKMGRETSIVRFEDNTPIPSSVVDEVSEILQHHVVPVVWRKYDFVLIDNTRTLHGRRAFTDANREIYLRMVRDVDF